MKNAEPSIADATVTIGGEYTFTGSQIKPTEVTVVLDGETLVLGEDYTLSYSDNRNAGENAGTVTVTGIGAYAGTCDATFNIAKAKLTVTGTTADGKTYDGTTNADVMIGDLSGVLDGTDVSIASVTGAFENKNAGNGKTVNLTYTLGGADKDNYELDNGTTVADISPKQLTVNTRATLAVVNQGAGETTLANPGTLIGTVEGDSVTLSATAPNCENPGTQDMNVTYAISGEDAGNYAAPVSATVSGYARIYVTDGQSYTLTAGSSYTNPYAYTGEGDDDGAAGEVKAGGTLTGQRICFERNIGSKKYGAFVNAGNTTFDGDNMGTLFYDNSAVSMGGAVFNAEGATMTLEKDAYFGGNIAVDGGGVYNLGTLNLYDYVEFGDNQATGSSSEDGTVVTPGKGGAVYNGGTLNIAGTVALRTNSDTIYNAGEMNWDLTGENALGYGGIQGYQYVTNADTGELTLTVNENQTAGGYVLALGNFNGETLQNNGTGTYILTGVDGANDVQITVGDTDVSYGNSKYTLFVDTNPDDATQSALVLGVQDRYDVSVDESLQGKWFTGVECTITGTYFARGGVTPVITVSGKTADIDTEAKTWSCTIFSKDTTGTEYTINLFKENDPTVLATSEYILRVDTLAPKTEIVLYGILPQYTSSEGVYWYKREDTESYAYIYFDSSDETSGVKNVMVGGRDLAGLAFVPSTEWPDVNYIPYYAIDNAGNTEKERKIGIGVDGTGPSISDVALEGDSKYVADGDDTTGGSIVWFQKGDESAALKATVNDNRSGLKEAKVGEVAYKDGQFALDVAQEGDFTAQIKATDNVGNESTGDAIAYRVDGTGPSISDVAFQGDSKYDDGATVWFKKGDETAALKATIEDDGSGFKEATFQDGAAENDKFSVNTSTEGTISGDIKATDNVGNTATENVSYKVDGTGPSISDVAFQGDSKYDDGVTVWFKKGDDSAALKATIEDDGSGLKEATFQDGEYKEGQFSIDTSAEGAKSGDISASDNVGNTATETVSYKVDGTGPSISDVAFQGESKYVADGDDTTGGSIVWFKKGDETAALKATIEDDGSGFKEATFQDGAAENDKFSVNTSTEGTISGDIKATDNVGNTATETVSYKVDGTGPTITMAVDPTETGVASVTVTATFADEGGSGVDVATQQYSLDGGVTWNDYTEAFTVTKNGEIQFKAKDNVGNESIETLTITNIDTTAPAITTWQEGGVVYGKSEAGASLKYRLSEADDWQECPTEGVQVTSDNAEVFFKAVDAAGNENELAFVVNASVIPPVEDPVSITGENVNWGGGETTEGKEYVVTITDEDSALEISTTDGGMNILGGDSSLKVGVKDTEGETLVEPTALHDTIPEEAADTPVIMDASNADADQGNLFLARVDGVWDNGYVARHRGYIVDGQVTGATNEYVKLAGLNKITDIFNGSADGANVLALTDEGNGDVLFVDDIYSASAGDLAQQQARVANITEVLAGAGNDIVDFTSQKFAYTGDGVFFHGGDGDDVIWANHGCNALFGDAGDDQLVGAEGDDFLAGGLGNDTLNGNGGDDFFTYGDYDWGTDTILQSSGSTNLWFDGVARDDITLNADANGDAIFSRGNGAITLKGVACADIIDNWNNGETELADNLTVKFGDDGSGTYDALVAADGFKGYSSTSVFASSNIG